MHKRKSDELPQEGAPPPKRVKLETKEAKETNEAKNSVEWCVNNGVPDLSKSVVVANLEIPVLCSILGSVAPELLAPMFGLPAGTIASAVLSLRERGAINVSAQTVAAIAT